MPTWHGIRLPPGANSQSIRKETGTQGRIFSVFDVDMSQSCWCSQSIPALIGACNLHRSRAKRLFESSAYRVLRGASRSSLHKGHRIVAFRRDAVQERVQRAHRDGPGMLRRHEGAGCLAPGRGRWRIAESSPAIHGLQPTPREQDPNTRQGHRSRVSSSPGSRQT